jgi:tetraacyldisaccharide 4'-kinase
MKTPAAELYRRVASQDDGPAWLPPLRLAAAALSRLYGLAAGGHHLAYDLGWADTRRLPVPVIGVGNLTVGGTGKTPLVMEVVKALQGLGLPCAVISRGYGGQVKDGVAWVSRGQGPLMDAAQAGDEPVLLAKRLAVPVAVGPDRFLVGQEVVRRLGPCVLVGDDLFQHRGLHRDLDLVALDAAQPLGNGRLLPRGPLREPSRGLRRASAIVLTHADDPDREQATRTWLRAFWGRGPVLSCRHRVSGLHDLEGRELSRDVWIGQRVLAFCGLGAPEKFARGLGGLGLEVASLQAFGDHHPFLAADLAGLWQKAQAFGATALVTSEKDWVRLPPDLPQGIEVWTTRLELDFTPGGPSLAQVLPWGLSAWARRA